MIHASVLVIIQDLNGKAKTDNFPNIPVLKAVWQNIEIDGRLVS